MAFSPDGTTLVAGDSDLNSWLKSWETPACNVVPSAYVGHAGLVFFLSLSPDGERAVSADRGRVKLWRTDDLTELLSFELTKDSPIGSNAAQGLGHVATSADGRFLAISQPDSVNIYSAVTGKAVQFMLMPDEHGSPGAIALSSDGQRLAAALRPARDAAEVRKESAPTKQPSGKRARNRQPLKVMDTISVVNVDGTGPRQEFKTGDLVHKIAFSPGAFSPGTKSLGGALLAIVGDTALRVYSLHTGQLVYEAERCTEAAFSPDGGRLGTLSNIREYKLPVFNEAGQRILEIPLGALYNGLAWSPDGRVIAAGGLLFDSQSGKELAWNAEAETVSGSDVVKAKIGSGSPVTAVAFSADGRWWAAGHWDGTVSLLPLSNISAAADRPGR